MKFRIPLLCAAVLCAGTMVCPAGDPPVVLLVGIDGLRWDALKKHQPPNLTELAAEGVSAERLIASFPTLTFPNFYTVATGLRPARHGIVGNTMFDPEWKETFSLRSPAVADGRWWGGEPIWVTAENQGLRTACMFWPGSEAEIQGMRPREWRKFDASISPEERVRIVLDWLAKPVSERPRLITLYFEDVDSAGHKFGPDSAEAGQAIARIDAALGTLREGVHRLGLSSVVNVVVVSDHGMTDVSPDRVVSLTELVDPAKATIDFSGAVAGVRPREGVSETEVFAALQARPGPYRVVRRQDMPERFHFREHRRIPPILVLADAGWTLSPHPPSMAQARDLFPKGAHGFDPELPDMGATFLAAGPAFRKGVTIPPFENVQIYGLLCALLDLRPAKNDGDERLLRRILLHPPP